MMEPGDTLLGKYRIDRVLGRGGMGVVARAHHIHLDEPVAIKFLHPDMLKKEQVVKRFLREAQAAVKLKSEHVCRVFDVGTLDNDAPYMVMEFMAGNDLAHILADQGCPRPEVTVDFILQACDALAEAHALGIVHRDLKPSNLFITHRADGSPLLKVLDFGISKAATSPTETELTHTNTVLGTPAYMSPEQMRSAKHVDARSDIWALGVILFQMFTGRRPFTGSAYPELCLQVVMEPTPPMGVELSSGLEEIVARCLRKEPGQRYQNVAALAAALAPFATSPALAKSRVERASRTLGVPAVTPAWSDEAKAPAAGAAAGEDKLLLHGDKRDDGRGDTSISTTLSLYTPPEGVTSRQHRAPGEPSTITDSAGQFTLIPSKSRRSWWLVALIGVVGLVAGALLFSTGSGCDRGDDAAVATEIAELAVQSDAGVDGRISFDATPDAGAAAKVAVAVIDAAPPPPPSPRRRPPAAVRRKQPPSSAVPRSEVEAQAELKRASALLRERKYADAKNLYEQILKSPFRKREAMLGRANVAYKTGKYNEVVELAREAIPLGGGNTARMLVGNAYFRMGRYAEAKVFYRAVLRADTNHRSARKALEKTLLKLGQ